MTTILWVTATIAFSLALASHDLSVVGRQVGALGLDRGPGALGEHARPARANPCVASRSPAARRGSRWPGHRPAHDARCPAVGNRLMSGPISARMTSAARIPTPVTRVEDHQLTRPGLDHLGDPLRQRSDVGLQRFDMGQHAGQQVPMMLTEPGRQRLPQLRQLRRQPGLGQIGQQLRVGHPGRSGRASSPDPTHPSRRWLPWPA